MLDFLRSLTSDSVSTIRYTNGNVFIGTVYDKTHPKKGKKTCKDGSWLEGTFDKDSGVLVEGEKYFTASKQRCVGTFHRKTGLMIVGEVVGPTWILTGSFGDNGKKGVGLRSGCKAMRAGTTVFRGSFDPRSSAMLEGSAMQVIDAKAGRTLRLGQGLYEAGSDLYSRLVDGTMLSSRGTFSEGLFSPDRTGAWLAVVSASPHGTNCGTVVQQPATAGFVLMHGVIVDPNKVLMGLRDIQTCDFVNVTHLLFDKAEATPEPESKTPKDDDDDDQDQQDDDEQNGTAAPDTDSHATTLRGLIIRVASVKAAAATAQYPEYLGAAVTTAEELAHFSVRAARLIEYGRRMHPHLTTQLESHYGAGKKLNSDVSLAVETALLSAMEHVTASMDDIEQRAEEISAETLTGPLERVTRVLSGMCWGNKIRPSVRGRCSNNVGGIGNATVAETYRSTGMQHGPGSFEMIAIRSAAPEGRGRITVMDGFNPTLTRTVEDGFVFAVATDNTTATLTAHGHTSTPAWQETVTTRGRVDAARPGFLWVSAPGTDASPTSDGPEFALTTAESQWVERAFLRGAPYCDLRLRHRSFGRPRVTFASTSTDADDLRQGEATVSFPGAPSGHSRSTVRIGRYWSTEQPPAEALGQYPSLPVGWFAYAWGPDGECVAALSPRCVWRLEQALLDAVATKTFGETESDTSPFLRPDGRLQLPASILSELTLYLTTAAPKALRALASNGIAANVSAAVSLFPHKLIITSEEEADLMSFELRRVRLCMEEFATLPFFDAEYIRCAQGTDDNTSPRAEDDDGDESPDTTADPTDALLMGCSGADDVEVAVASLEHITPQDALQVLRHIALANGAMVFVLDSGSDSIGWQASVRRTKAAMRTTMHSVVANGFARANTAAPGCDDAGADLLRREARRLAECHNSPALALPFVATPRDALREEGLLPPVGSLQRMPTVFADDDDGAGPEKLGPLGATGSSIRVRFGAVTEAGLTGALYDSLRWLDTLGRVTVPPEWDVPAAADVEETGRQDTGVEEKEDHDTALDADLQDDGPPSLSNERRVDPVPSADSLEVAPPHAALCPAPKARGLLYCVAKDSAEFAKVSAAFQAGAFNKTIACIQRVQNRPLWEKYMLMKRQVSQECGGDPSEVLWMKHGTRASNPLVICSHGFDHRYCEKGFYGRATYFAYSSWYSHSFRHNLMDVAVPETPASGPAAAVPTSTVIGAKTPKGLKGPKPAPKAAVKAAPKYGQMILAAVVRGKVDVRKAKVPDLKHPLASHHTVEGPVTDAGSLAVMIYDLHLAYPSYLVTYEL